MLSTNIRSTSETSRRWYCRCQGVRGFGCPQQLRSQRLIIQQIEICHISQHFFFDARTRQWAVRTHGRDMNYEGSTHPMSRLREDAKKGTAKNREPHANVLKTGRAQNASARRQSTSARRGLQKERQLGVDVGIQRPKDGDVAHNELRHDTTSSLRTDEQEGEVQEQQAQQPYERFAR